MENFILYPWHWLVTGLVLIGLEALGFGGFLLGGALAGLIMSVVSWMDSSLKWTVQVIIFSGLTVIFTIIYW
ncbi:MAG: NfeD family protein, partial [Endozoicomonadaceae bacterium]|nr:NfeD family protein [Endozoicomonadaceae bacterium]